MGTLTLVAGVLMAAALAASLLAGRLRVPGLLLFLGLGMLVGSDGLGWLPFDDYELARDLGIVALALILYEGALTTNVAELRPVAGPALSLAVLGTLLTAFITGVAASWLFDLPLLEGLLLGSIVASTDVAAIFAMLRGSGLQARLARLLEGEAASNDPVAILLVIGFIEWLTQPDAGVTDMLVLFVKQMAIGVAVGAALGWLGVRAMRAVTLPTLGLYPVASLTVGAIAFGAADVLGGSGFFAIYLAGLTLSASAIPAKRTIVAFHHGLAWVAQLSMFMGLGLLVFPSQLGSVAIEGTVLALVLMLVARPVATVVASLGARLTPGERIVLGWAGLRGAVPVVLATFPVIAGIPGSLEFFNIVFFAVVLSLLVQGPTFEPLARRLGLTVPDPAGATPITELGMIRGLGAELVEYSVGPGHAAAGAYVRDLGLPHEALVSVIVRNGEAVPPRGSMRVEPGDRLHVLVRQEVAREVGALMERWRVGPLQRPRPLRRKLRSTAPVFTVRPFGRSAVEGDPRSPTVVAGTPVAARLRMRRDTPGALVALEDGRYAVTGPLVMVGSRNDLTAYARRRLTRADENERVWLQSVVGALAVDAFRSESRPRFGSDAPDGRADR